MIFLTEKNERGGIGVKIPPPISFACFHVSGLYISFLKTRKYTPLKS